VAPSRKDDATLTDAEWTVMNAVWRHDPATAREVLDAVCRETGWAYTTVKTLLDRLVKKGALSSTKEGQTSVYVAALPQREARRGALRDVLRRAFGGAPGSMAHFLLGTERLSARERRDLIRLLRAQGRRGRGGADRRGEEGA
jgi:BlaI family penicillinase repressor